MTDNELAKAMYRNKEDIQAIMKASSERKQHTYSFSCAYDSGPDAIFEYYIDGELSDRIYIRASLKGADNKIFRVHYKHLKSGTKEEYLELTPSFFSTMVKNTGEYSSYCRHAPRDTYRLVTGHSTYNEFYSYTNFATRFIELFTDASDCEKLVKAVNAKMFLLSERVSSYGIKIPPVDELGMKIQKALVPKVMERTGCTEAQVKTALDPSHTSTYDVPDRLRRYVGIVDSIKTMSYIYGFDSVMANLITPWMMDEDIWSLDWHKSDVFRLLGRNNAGSSYAEGMYTTYQGDSEKLAAAGFTPYDIRGLANYYLGTLKREGFKDAIRAACDLHADCIEAERTVYGRVKEKYPKYLDSYHRRITQSAKVIKALESSMREEGLEAQFRRAMEVSKRWEITYKKWSWRPFESLGELKDVADNILHNCLKTSYIRPIAEGTTEVILMFERVDPETPKYAIEIRSDAPEEDNGYDYGTHARSGKFWIKQAYGDQINGLARAHLPADAHAALQKMLEKAIRKMSGIYDAHAEEEAEKQETIKLLEDELAVECSRADKLRKELVDLQNNTILDDF